MRTLKMKIKTKKIRLFYLIGALAAFMIFSSNAANAASLDLLPEDDKKVEELLSKTIENKIKRGTYFLLGIESKLKDSKEELKLLRKNIRNLEKRITDSRVSIGDIQSQMENLDKLISENEKKIRSSEIQMAAYANGINILKDDIKQKQNELKNQVKTLDLALNTYYLQTNLFFDSKDNSPLLLAFLSTDSSTGDILRENEYLYSMQNAGQQLAIQITNTQNELYKKQNQLEDREKKMNELSSLLAREKRTLLASQEAKQRLLEETQGKQLIYESLLELSKKEEEQVSTSIERLKENYSFFEQKLEELKSNPETFDIPESQTTENDEPIFKGDSIFSWPVSPNGGITAYFRDAEYQRALGIPHNAIDIRLAQGSKVKSSADGVISKVADNGYAYSYVIILHPGGFLTLYGHLSEIFVKEGEIVRQGQVIGLSGGIPGTKGAGWLTTGAHLHFEVFKNFRQTDPLEYLPLEYLPLSSLPEKYLNRITGEQGKKVRRLQLAE